MLPSWRNQACHLLMMYLIIGFKIHPYSTQQWVSIHLNILGTCLVLCHGNLMFIQELQTCIVSLVEVFYMVALNHVPPPFPPVLSKRRLLPSMHDLYLLNPFDIQLHLNVTHHQLSFEYQRIGFL